MIPVGVLPPGSRVTVDDVFDVGDRWEFVFSRSGREVARIGMTRDELRAAQWRVVVPSSTEEGLDG
jgi:hypothetical protein